MVAVPPADDDRAVLARAERKIRADEPLTAAERGAVNRRGERLVNLTDALSPSGNDVDYPDDEAANRLFDALVQADNDAAHGQPGIPWRDYFASRASRFRPRADEALHDPTLRPGHRRARSPSAEGRSPGLDDAVAKALDLLQLLPEMGAPVRQRGASSTTVRSWILGYGQALPDPEDRATPGRRGSFERTSKTPQDPILSIWNA